MTAKPPTTLVLLAAALLWMVAACGGGAGSTEDSTGEGTSAPPGGASASPADDFLATYVTSDGRVLRHDQGDDVVSEGQAYGMLIAELDGRDDTVRTIWSWTRDHLRTRTGLLAYHADAGGNVLDPQPASDADTLAAYALLRYSGPGAGSMHADGRRLASAVLAHETVKDSRGRPVLTAGPWATSSPVVVNPSYLMPSVFEEIGRLTRSSRWSALAASAVPLIAGLTHGGGELPADWTRLEATDLIPSGSGGDPASKPQYGADAQRAPMWLASGCGTSARRLSAAWWSILQQDDRSSALALSLPGDPVDPSGSVVALLAAAASARAAGDHEAADQLRRGATQAERGTPTYYGAAWLALSAGLDDGTLVPCPGAG